MKYFSIFLLVHSVSVCLGGVEDYWNDDYDATKNCKERETIERLFNSNPEKCAMGGKGKQSNKMKTFFKNLIN